MPPTGFADWPDWWASSGDLMTLVLRAFVVLWSFALGASVGSFLNVVVYRLPAGLNLSRPKSRCPRCETAIRPTDNLPVLGWLRLRGRCRACGLPIAARYPLVETICGATLALLALEIVLLGGVNLPIEIGRSDLATQFLRQLEPEAVALCGVLFVGSATLLGAGLIALDGHRVPWRLLAFGLLCPAAVAAVWPGVRVGEPGMWGGGPWRLAGRSAGYDLGLYRFAPNLPGPRDVLAGGLLWGAIAAALTPAFKAGADRWNLVAVGAIAGAWWGWWAGGIGLGAGGVVAFAAPLLYGVRAVRTRVPPAAFAAFGTAAVPLAWALISFDPTRTATVVGTLAACGAFALAGGAVVDRLFFPDRAGSTDASGGAGL